MKTLVSLLGWLVAGWAAMTANAATITWVNPAGGNWSQPANWSPNQVPGTNDTAAITTDGNYTVTMDGNANVAGLVVGATDGGATTQTFLNNGQTLTVYGPITVTAQGRFDFADGSLVGVATLSGPLNWQGGTFNGSLTVLADGVLNLYGYDELLGPLTNNGTVNWQGGTLTLLYGNYGYTGEIWNQAGAQWNIQCDETLFDWSGEEVFNNAGTLTKLGTTGTTHLEVYLNNTGSVVAMAGAIELDNGCNLGGTFQASAGAAIYFSGGNFTLSGAQSFQGPGTVQIINGDVAITGRATNLVLSGVNVSGVSNLVGAASLTNCTDTGPDVIVGAINWQGGAFNATLKVASNAVLNAVNAAFNGAVTAAGTLNWQGGVVNPGGSLTVTTNGVLNLAGNDSLYVPLTNKGTVNWTTGTVVVFSGGADTGGLWNVARAQWNIGCDESLVGTSGAVRFNNAGTLTKSGTSGTTTFTNVLLNSTGVINADEGLISLNGGATLAGFINFQIDDTTNYGSLYVADTAAFGGLTASLTLTTNYSPQTGDAFGLAGWNLLAGVNGPFGGLKLPAAVAWQTNYGATNFTVSILNVRPVLPPIPTQTVGAWQTLTLEVSATDPDVTAGNQTLTCELTVFPAGASLDPNGVFTWTPDQTQSPSTNLVTVVVADNGTPPLSATNTFTVIVQDVNTTPVLPVQPDETVNELTLLTVTNTAGDAGLHSILSYVLVNPPAGAGIDTNGIITWTPGQTQSPGTNVFTTIVTNSDPYDLVNPLLTATNSFTVIVQEVNVPPTLPVLPAQMATELRLLTVTNTATNANLHSTNTGYSLISAPDGMVISVGGVITWTPSLAQSLSTNLVTTLVTNHNPFDLVNPQLTATNTFTVIVQSGNVPPVLPGQTNVTINELTLLTVTNTASEANPGSTLGYTLVNPPAGAGIDTNGIITWTPGQTQSPGTNVFTTIVTNSDPYDLTEPHLSATNSFTVIVREVNLPPTPPFVAPQTVHELTQLTVTNAATNANLHSTITGYTLINAPAGVAISPGGVITWTPAQNQSPGTNLITTVVANHNPFDLVNPQLTATNTFTIIVQEVNQAPVLPLMGPQTLYAQTTLTVTNTAVETNVHATVTYGLVNPPAGLAINASGVITWTPAATQSPGANPVTTVATSTDWLDPVNPLLYATNTFSVTVIPLPVLTPPVNLGGGAFQLSFNTLAHGSYTIEYSTNLTIWNPVNVITGDGSPRTLSLTNAPGDRQGFYRLQVAP